MESYQISNISFSPCVFVVFLQVTTQSLSRANMREAIPEVDTVKDEVFACESDCKLRVKVIAELKCYELKLNTVQRATVYCNWTVH